MRQKISWLYWKIKDSGDRLAMRTADFVVERQVDDLADADNKKFVATKRRYVAVRTCIRVKLHLNFFYVKMKFHVNSISTLSTHLEVQLH